MADQTYTMVSAPLGVAGEYPSHQAKLAQGGIHIFNDIAERDAMWDTLKIDNMTIALVKDGEGKYPSWYIWTGTEWEFAGYFGGMVMADTDGALTRIESTAVFGPDFQIQNAGDQGNGVLLMLSDEVKAELAKKAGTAAAFKTGPYLELVKRDGGNVLEIKPMSFELRKSPGYLAYMQYPELVYGKAKEGQMYRKGTLWFDMIRVSPEGMLQIDRNNKAIGLQETDAKDPNVTGGSKFLVWPFVYLDGVAPDDGYVELIWYKKSDGTIATDMNGHPMAVRHNYKRGQELTPPHEPIMFAQPQAAKGLTEYCLAVVDNFDEYISVRDYSDGPSGICIQELSDSGTSSEALLQAEADTGFNIRMERYYVGTYLASINYLTSIPEKAQTIKAGSKANTVAGIEMYAVTDVEYAVSQGMIQVGAVGLDIADFYIALELNQSLTRTIAGGDIVSNLAIQDKDDGWNVGFFTYSGDMSKRPPIYSARNNGSITLNAGWTKFGSDFVSEDVVSGIHSQTSANTAIPSNADNVFVAIYPVAAQNPCTLNLKSFHIDAANPGDHISVNDIVINGLQHLDFMTKTVRMFQGLSTKDATTGKVVNRFSALRYTDGPGDLPMPFGVPQSKLEYLHLDKSLNVISGSGAQGGEGGLIADEHVEVTIYQKWQLYNELASSNEAEYWLNVTRDDTGVTTEIPHSRTTFTVDPKRPGVDYFTTNTVSATLEPGDYITAHCSSSVKDGAYAQTNQPSKPLCITYITEKYLG